MKRTCKTLFILLLACALTVPLVGCRISPALVDVVYTADAEEVDPEPTARDFTEEGDEDEDAAQEREEDDAEEQNTEIDQAEAEQEDETQEDASYDDVGDSYTDEDAEESDHTGDGSPTGSSENSGEDSGGTLTEASDNADGSGGTAIASNDSGGTSGTSDGTGGSSAGDSAADTGDTGNTSDDTDNTNDTNTTNGTDTDNSGSDADPSGGGASADEAPVKDVAKKVVTDGSGTQQEIPEDVYTVTAVGQAAPIVVMVGGVGRLIGTSESFVSNEIGSMVLAGDADAEVSTWWSGDGSGGISDESFTALLQASPDVCFEISGEATFTSEQVEQLEAHGIGYLVLPELSSSDNLKEAVQIVAQALETNENTGQSAAVIADKYSDWVDECLSDAAGSRKALDYWSLYISDWRDDVTYTRRYEPGFMNGNYTAMIVDFPGVENGTGSGVAVAKVDKDADPFYEFWAAAGVYDLATDAPINEYGLESQEHYTDLTHAALNGYTECYVFPYYSWFGIPTFSNQSIYYYLDYYAEEYSLTAWLSVKDLTGYNDSTFTKLNMDWAPSKKLSRDPSYHLGGSERYAAIIVADEDTKESISNSPQWKAGFLDGTWVEEYAFDIAGDYEIYVNPSGFGNWAEGSVDSPLEAYWILWKISGGLTESRVKSEVKSFYSDFFGITLSDTQISEMINQ